MNVLVRSIKSIRFGRLNWTRMPVVYLMPCGEQNCAYAVGVPVPAISVFF